MSLCFPLSVAQWLVVIELDNGLVSIHLFFYYADQFFKTGLGFGLEPQHQYGLGIGGTDQCPSIVKVDPYAIDVNDFVLIPVDCYSKIERGTFNIVSNFFSISLIEDLIIFIF